MATPVASSTIPELIKQKLAAFERIRPEFEKCFHFLQDVHGQKRFAAFPVASSVYYLHALWLCECKDRLLSVYKNIQRYEGRRCLELLRQWQEGDTAEVIEFLSYKLDMLPLGDITRQLQEARRLPTNEESEGLIKRLEHGRLVMLNRGMNLMRALDAIFSLSDDALLVEVRAACQQYGHTAEQIELQLAEMNSPLYAYRLHQALAQQNMTLMNKLGITVLTQPTDAPGDRTQAVLDPEELLSPFAIHVIKGYQQLRAPEYNNRLGVRFIDRPERSDTMEI